MGDVAAEDRRRSSGREPCRSAARRADCARARWVAEHGWRDARKSRASGSRDCLDHQDGCKNGAPDKCRRAVLFMLCAEGGTRTPTSLRPLAPEASASTSSTTSAGKGNVVFKRPKVNADRHFEGHREARTRQDFNRAEPPRALRISSPGDVRGWLGAHWNGGEVTAVRE